MRVKIAKLSLIATLILTGHTASHAADSLVEGRRLVIKNRSGSEQHNRILVAARSGALKLGAAGSDGDPTCSGAGGGGGQITFSSTTSGQSYTAPLPCRNWTASHGSLRYKDHQLADGTCKLIVIRGGRILHATCLSGGAMVLAFDLSVGQKQDPVAVTLQLGTAPNRYCLSFGGLVNADGSNGTSFVARNSPAPAACPAPPLGSPSGAFIDGPLFP